MHNLNKITEVNRKKALLDDELVLIQQHLDEQHNKIDVIKTEDAEIYDSISFVEKTISSLETQLEKSKILPGV